MQMQLKFYFFYPWELDKGILKLYGNAKRAGISLDNFEVKDKVGEFTEF